MGYKRDEQFKELFPQDIDLFYDIFQKFINLNDEDFVGAYVLSKKSLVMMARFSDLEVQASKLAFSNKNFNKTDIKTFCHYKYKVMEYVHTMARMVWSRGEKNSKEG